MSTPEQFVCDLSHAPDSVEERLASYRTVFAALVGRHRKKGGFRFRFAADLVDRALLEDLVDKERACCPFLRIHLTAVGEEVWWDCEVDSLEALPFLDALYDLPDGAPDPVSVRMKYPSRDGGAR